MHPRLPWRHSFVLGTALLFASCAPTRDDVQAIRKELSDLKSQQDQAQKTLELVKSFAANTPSPVKYLLTDVSRKSKAVAHITSDVHITKGDRIFLGDDMWDVEYVKIYSTSVDRAAEPPTFHSGAIELLVSFGGKAQDPENSK